MALAGTVATPASVQAGADELYASARIGIEYSDTEGTADVGVNSYASRFGAQGETDLGNGLKGWGRYEWDVDFDDPGDGFKLRHRVVGVKGDFGNVYLGQTEHTFYNLIILPFDTPWWSSGYNMVRYGARTDKAVTFETSLQSFDFSITGYFIEDDDEEAPDTVEVGGSFGIGEMTLAFALDSSETARGSAGNDDDILGVTLSGIPLGDSTLAFNYMTQDDDDSYGMELLVGNIYVHVEALSSDATGMDPLLLTLGYTQTLGRKTKIWYEVVDNDADTGDSDDDGFFVRAVLLYDII